MRPLSKALIVDDEKDICYLLSEILKTKNLDVDFVNTISDAEKCIQEEQPDIIFLDNYLPDGLGVHFISKIKNIHPQAKVIMITAHDTYADREKAQITGIDDFIPKPFSREKIFSALANLTVNNQQAV